MDAKPSGFFQLNTLCLFFWSPHAQYGTAPTPRPSPVAVEDAQKKEIIQIFANSRGKKIQNRSYLKN